MNNIVLDVAIGLIFIYLLYSLLATTIKEFIATLFSYRSRMLEKGLEQMLDGKNYSYYWWDRLWNIINEKNKEKQTSKFYIKKNLFTNSISCHPLYIRSAENSGTSRKPSYLSADVFSDILIDVLKPNKDVPTLLKDIAASIKAKAANENDPLNEDLGKILALYIEQANGDLQRFRLLIENWYNDTMDRVSGWYKKQANKILIIIGLCLAITFNVSTIDIVKKLSEDKDVRNALVSNATDYVKNHIDEVKQTTKNSTDTSKNNVLINTTDTSKEKSNSLKTNPQSIPDTANADTTYEALRSKVDSMKAFYNTNIAEANTTLGLGWGDFGYTDDSLAWVSKGKPETCKPEYKGFFGKIGYVLWQSLTTPHYWLGFLITAFAISLGAPFWFDLLNKFVNLRVSGAKPDEGSTPVSKTALLNQKPDPTAKG